MLTIATEIAAFMGRRRLHRKHQLAAARERAFILDTARGAAVREGVA